MKTTPFHRKRRIARLALISVAFVVIGYFVYLKDCSGATPIKDLQVSGSSEIKSGTFSIQSGVIVQALAGSTITISGAVNASAATSWIMPSVGVTTATNANAIFDPNGTGAIELLAKTYVGNTAAVTPTANLHLAAGAATAGAAPLKMTLGPVLTTPEAGAFEFDGAEVYATTSTPTRKRIATDTAPVAIAAADINWSLGSTFTKTLAANTTFTFSNAVDGRTIVVALTNTASNYTVAWTGVTWSGGTAPTQTTGAKTDVYTFVKVGAVIYGSAVQNF